MNTAPIASNSRLMAINTTRLNAFVDFAGLLPLRFFRRLVVSAGSMLRTSPRTAFSALRREPSPIETVVLRAPESELGMEDMGQSGQASRAPSGFPCSLVIRTRPRSRAPTGFTLSVYSPAAAQAIQSW